MAGEVQEVLKYLKSYRTRKELEEKFTLSNTQSYHLINWLKKGNMIEEKSLRVSGRTNRQWFYIAKG